MNSFQDRERLFEAAFAYGEALLFRIRSRRDRLAAEWVAARIGLNDADRERYIAEIIGGGSSGPGGRDLHARLLGDLRAAGDDLSAHRLDKKLDALLNDAHRQVMEE